MFVDLSLLPISENFDGKVTFNKETAGFLNTLGMYTVKENGDIDDVSIIFANSSAVGSGGNLIENVSHVDYTFSAGDKIGFFVLPNSGSQSTASLLSDTKGSFYFGTKENTGPANVGMKDSFPLIHVSATGKETVIKTTYGAVSWHSTPSMNIDSTDHTFWELKVEGSALTFSMRFEDLWGGGDKDYLDVVFTLDVGPKNAVALANEFSAGGFSNAFEDVVDVTSKGFAVIDPVAENEGWSVTHIAGVSAVAGAVITLSDGSTATLLGDGRVRIDGANHTTDRTQLVEVSLAGNGDTETIYIPVTVSPVDGTEGDDQIHMATGFITVDGVESARGYIDGDGNMVDGPDGSAEVIMGYGGNDKIFTGDGDDEIYGGDGNDNLRAHAGDDLLSGGAGNDILGGETGNDTMFGGTGNDAFFVDSQFDVTVEYQNEGFDKVQSSVNWTLGDNFEVLRLSGQAIEGHGNGLNNWVHGQDLSNLLSGGSGNDTIVAMSGDDTVYGDDGRDRLVGRNGSDLMFGGEGNDKVFGNNGNDELWGGDGDDRIAGGSGSDTIIGGTGDDALFGHEGTDLFIFTQGDGRDKVKGIDGNDGLKFVNVDEDSLVWRYGEKVTVLRYGDEGDKILFWDAENIDSIQIEFSYD